MRYFLFTITIIILILKKATKTYCTKTFHTWITLRVISLTGNISSRHGFLSRPVEFLLFFPSYPIRWSRPDNGTIWYSYQGYTLFRQVLPHRLLSPAALPAFCPHSDAGYHKHSEPETEVMCFPIPFSACLFPVYVSSLFPNHGSACPVSGSESSLRGASASPLYTASSFPFVSDTVSLPACS